MDSLISNILDQKFCLQHFLLTKLSCSVPVLSSSTYEKKLKLRKVFFTGTPNYF
jgi:hypothetical protein